jgi:hypothetical protein
MLTVTLGGVKRLKRTVEDVETVVSGICFSNRRAKFDAISVVSSSRGCVT